MVQGEHSFVFCIFACNTKAYYIQSCTVIMENTNFYIFTGGPGSGKSTVLNILENMGYTTVREVARELIQNQVKTKGDAVPWNNTVRYAHLMLLRSVIDFEELVHSKRTVFFDRGIIDTLGYARLINIPVTDEMKDAAKKYRYNHRVFLFPFWKEVYIKDAERKQDIEEAESTFWALKKEYENFGYQTIDVPFLSPQKRVQWILQQIE